MTTFHQNNQKINGNQYNIGGNAKFNEVVLPLQKIISDIDTALETDSISKEIAEKAKKNIAEAVAEAQKARPNANTIKDKFQSAKELLEGLTSIGGLVKLVLETSELIKKVI